MENNLIELYNDVGFSIHGTSNELNQHNFGNNNRFKSPNQMEISSSKCIGTFLGCNNLRAIDVDGAISYDVIKKILDYLELPSNYSWVYKTGSGCGYHILFYCNLPSDKKMDQTDKSSYVFTNKAYEMFEFGGIDVNAYYPTQYQLTHSFPQYHKIEFMWKGNVILPGSLHISGGEYKFINGFPEVPPSEINFEKLKNVKSNFASTWAKRSNDIYYDGESYSGRSFSIHQLAYKEALDYNYNDNRNNGKLISVYFSQFAIHNSTSQGIFLNQVSWFVVGKNNNIIKRKIFNYYSKELNPYIYSGTMDISVAEEIISSQRLVFHELLFDIKRVKFLIMKNNNHKNVLLNEILNCGLYLDDFISDNDHYKVGYIDISDFKEEEEYIKPFLFIEDKMEQYMKMSEGDTKTSNIISFDKREGMKYLLKLFNDNDKKNAVFQNTLLFDLYMMDVQNCKKIFTKI